MRCQINYNLMQALEPELEQITISKFKKVIYDNGLKYQKKERPHGER